MNASELSRLAELIEMDTIPQWVKDEIETKSAAILTALERGETYSIAGPDGASVNIAARKAVA